MHVATKPYKQISTIVTAHHSYVAFEFHFRNIKAFSMAKCKMWKRIFVKYPLLKSKDERRAVHQILHTQFCGIFVV